MSSRYITDLLQENADRWPDKPAIVFEGQSLSWSELWRAVEQKAAALEPYLVADGQQVVGLLMPNCIEYVIADLAVVHLGHIVMPIDIIFKPVEIDAVIHQLRPALVVTDTNNRPRIGSEAAKVITYEDISPAYGQPKKLLRLSPKTQVASLFFTSGTTGRPKAVPNTHVNHIWNIETCSRVWDWTHQDSLLVSLRLTHMHGLVMGLTGCLYHGNTMYLQERFNEIKTLETLADGKITMFTHGPVAYLRMLEAPGAERYDLSSVRLCISGSAPLPPETWRRFKEIFGQEILEVYGSSETGRITSNLLDERLPGSPGRPLPEVELKLSTHSEVLIKSPGVFPGYFRNPQATTEATAPGGWWKTGDVGQYENGRLALKGRLAERIRRFGYDVSPRDVEWVLHKFPKVKESFVLGRQRPGSSDDELIYFLVGDATEAETHEFCKVNMPSVWRPDRIVFLDSIPRNRSGKPHLAVLKGMVD